MAKTYELTPVRKAFNWLITQGLRIGLAPPSTWMLTVRGRKSGTPYSTPVTLVEDQDRRWLVAPYGEVSWVKNARAAGKVTLSRGKRQETRSITELPPDEAAPVLKQYLTRIPVVKPFFDAKPDDSLEVFASEAPRHPVFRLG